MYYVLFIYYFYQIYYFPFASLIDDEIVNCQIVNHLRSTDMPRLYVVPVVIGEQ